MKAKDIKVGNYYQIRVGSWIPSFQVERIWVGLDTRNKRITRYVGTIVETGEPFVVRNSRQFREEGENELSVPNGKT